MITPEQVESWLKYPRKYGCSSLELSDWMKQETGTEL
jgi:hypothetical protein